MTVKMRFVAAFLALLVFGRSVGIECLGTVLLADDEINTEYSQADENLSVSLDELSDMDNAHIAGSAEESVSMDEVIMSLAPEAYVGYMNSVTANEDGQEDETELSEDVQDSEIALYANEQDDDIELYADEQNENDEAEAVEEATEAITDGTWVFSLHYDEDDESNYYHLNETGDFTVKYQFEFSSGSIIDPGKAIIRINKAIFKDINGNPVEPTDIGVPAFAEDSLEKDADGYYTIEDDGYTYISTSPFNYFYETGEDGEEYVVFVNYKPVTAGTNTAVQVLYDNIKAFDVEDMTEWQLDAEVKVGEEEISTKKGDIKPLTGVVDTSVSITSFTKEEYNDPTVSYTPALYTAKQVNKYAGTSLESLEDGYIYLVYKTTVKGTANQRFDLYLDDIVPKYGEVVGVTKGSNFTAAHEETVTVNGKEEKLWDIGYYHVNSSDMSGFSSDKAKDSIYKNGEYSVDAYVVVKYNINDIPDDCKQEVTYTDDYEQKQTKTVYNLTNTATATIDPYDKKDAIHVTNNNAAEGGDATPAETKWEPYIWSYIGTHGGDGIDKSTTKKQRKNSLDLYGWLEEYKLHSDSKKDYDGGLTYTVSSNIRSYEATHQNIKSGDYETYTGGYVHTITADDVLYITDTNGTKTQLTSKDYYITSVNITVQDKGRDVWEDADTKPMSTADLNNGNIDRNWYVLGKTIDGNEWVEIGKIEWSDNGGEIKAGFVFDTNKYYRIKVAHNTVDYSSSCKMEISVAIKAGSTVFGTLLSKWDEDSTYYATLTNYAATGAYEVGTATKIKGHGGGTVITITGEGDTLPTGVTGYIGDEILTNPYRISAAYNLRPITETSGMSKIVDDWFNDTNNARVSYSYTIGAYDGYRVFSKNVVDEIITANGSGSSDTNYTNLNNRKAVVIYDLLPYKVHYDGSTAPKIAHITDTGALSNAASTAWSEDDVTLADTSIIPNYNDTGRELVAFTLEYNGSDAAAYKNSAWTAAYGVQFSAYVTWNNYQSARGKDNIAAYTSANDTPLIVRQIMMKSLERRALSMLILVKPWTVTMIKFQPSMRVRPLTRR